MKVLLLQLRLQLQAREVALSLKLHLLRLKLRLHLLLQRLLNDDAVHRAARVGEGAERQRCCADQDGGRKYSMYHDGYYFTAAPAFCRESGPPPVRTAGFLSRGAAR